MNCPLCTVEDRDFNKFGKDKLSSPALPRPDFDLEGALVTYDALSDWEDKLAFSGDLRLINCHFPVRLAFASLTTKPWSMYIVDILHQIKKGMMAYLLAALKAKSKADKTFATIKRRMELIPAYSGLEKFKRCWFDVSKMTASNYRDMVNIEIPCA